MGQRIRHLSDGNSSFNTAPLSNRTFTISQVWSCTVLEFHTLTNNVLGHFHFIYLKPQQSRCSGNNNFSMALVKPSYNLNFQDVYCTNDAESCRILRRYTNKSTTNRTPSKCSENIRPMLLKCVDANWSCELIKEAGSAVHHRPYTTWDDILQWQMYQKDWWTSEWARTPSAIKEDIAVHS